jgi:hypothetical protein
MLEVRNSQGTLLSLPLEDISDGLVLADVEGLEPVKATLVSSSFAQMDGEQYHSSRREARNIRIHLDLEPDYIADDVRTLRKLLYTFFMPKSEVQLRFYMQDELIVNIMGRVETFETQMFAKEPKAVISLLCYDPDFIDLEPVLIEDETTDTTDEFLVEYDGTVETGIFFQLLVDRTVNEFTIYHRRPDNSLHTLDFAADPLAAGDVLTINTVSGSKGATLLRTGTTTSVLYGVSPQASWIELQPGENYLRVYAEGDPIPFEITYSNRYGGL